MLNKKIIFIGLTGSQILVGEKLCFAFSTIEGKNRGENMISCQYTECSDTLLDMLCYEAYRERLSPEMEALLAGHLAECEHCRSKVLSLSQMLEKQPGSINSLFFLIHPHCSKVT